MRSNKPLRINNVLGKSEISRLLSRARALRKLDVVLHDLIPSPLNEHCRILSLQDATLTLAADSPVWAARLRFQATQLVKQLSNSQTVRLRTVNVRIRPPDGLPVTRTPGNRPRLSRRATYTLKQTARNVADPELKAALLRLANRRKPSDQH